MQKKKKKKKKPKIKKRRKEEEKRKIPKGVGLLALFSQCLGSVCSVYAHSKMLSFHPATLS
jgi:hypothetical protein